MKIFIKIIWKLRLILRIPFYRKVRGSRLWIPAEHRILEIQKRYTKYDRFLPILAEYLPKASLVIDVGANIGDTAIPMATANNSLHFVCVEPNKSFLFYLELNTRKLKSRIQNIPALIGVSDELFLLEGHGGTRHMKLDQSGQRCQSLDDVVTKIRFPNPISLIKIDTDGNELDVLKGFLGSFEAGLIATVLVETHPSNRNEIEAFFSELNFWEDESYLKLDGHSNHRREAKGNKERTKVYVCPVV